MLGIWKQKFLQKRPLINLNIFALGGLSKILIHKILIGEHINVLDWSDIVEVLSFCVARHVVVDSMMGEFGCPTDDEVVAFVDHVHFVGAVVGIDEVEAVVVEGKGFVLGGLDAVDLFLLLDESDLACTEEELLVDFSLSEVGQPVFKLLASEIFYLPGVGVHFLDDFPEKLGSLVRGEEELLNGWEFSDVLIDFFHVLEGFDVE